MQQLKEEKRKEKIKLDEDLLGNFLEKENINSTSDIKKESKRENDRIDTFLKDNNVKIHYCYEYVHF